MLFVSNFSSKCLLALFVVLLSFSSTRATSTANVLKTKNICSGDCLKIAQQDTLPFPPSSIYKRVVEDSERLLEGQKLPSELSVEQWRRDLDALAGRIHGQLPYSEAATGGAHFHQLLDSLKQAIPGQTRDQRLMSIMRLGHLPTPGTGHMNINPRQRVFGWRAFPLQPFKFADGTYIMRAADSTLIGKELLSIGGAPMDSVYSALAPYSKTAGAKRSHHYIDGWLLNFANPLRAVGIIDQIDKIPVRVRNKDGTVQRVIIDTMPYDSAEHLRVHISSATNPPVPEELQWATASLSQNVNQPRYRYSYRDSTDLLYLQYNVVAPPSDSVTAEGLAKRLGKIAHDRPIDKFVLDLRTNSGGSNRYAEPIIELLSTHPKINRRGTLYTLISRETFSAAGLMAMELERRTKTFFAGRPSGFAPNIWGETVPYQLPNSKIMAELSYAYHQGGMPDDPRPHLDVDLHVPMTSDQYFQNVDSTLIAVKEHDPDPVETVSLSSTSKTQFKGTYRISPIHRAEITDTKKGLHLRVDRGESFPFIDTQLYPQSSTYLKTDIRDVYLKRRPNDQGVMLVWKDTTYVMKPVDSEFILPLEHIKADRLDKAEEALRSILKSDLKLSNDFTDGALTDLVEENPIPAWPDSLTKKEKAQRALPYAELATELVPMSWEGHIDVAWLNHILGNNQEMIQAAQKTVNLAPIDGADFVREYLDLEISSDGKIVN
jgi:hypothetical protein